MNDASKEHTQVPVSAQILGRYVGTYKFTGTAVMTVRLEGDHLATQLTGQGWVDFFPMSDKRPVQKDPEGAVNFTGDLLTSRI
ncbi:hypothetical protein [Burkholderia sp. Ed8]|uniref:DUF3471 domain-containing protein n=1 Tax=Burkholderia sp. Ed8 TaxID=3112957 RepID=UPI00345D61E4